jgi:hypothetical protein
MYGLSKVGSALETRKYIILGQFVSFIDKSDHRFMWCGASVLSGGPQSFPIGCSTKCSLSPRGNVLFA